MNLVRRPRLMSVINTLLALTLIIVAGRSEANCFSAGSQPVQQSQMMENCADMEASLVSPEDHTPTHHSDKQQAGMCHLGCSVLMLAADEKRGLHRLYSLIYLREPEQVTVGISVSPQTPPPRFG